VEPAPTGDRQEVSTQWLALGAHQALLSDSDNFTYFRERRLEKAISRIRPRRFLLWKRPPGPVATRTTRKGIKMNRVSKGLYPDSRMHILVIYDLRTTGTAERLDREHEGWQGNADVEMFDLDHAVLAICPGGARRLVR
jgi:hypothetical protein